MGKIELLLCAIKSAYDCEFQVYKDEKPQLTRDSIEESVLDRSFAYLGGKKLMLEFASSVEQPMLILCNASIAWVVCLRRESDQRYFFVVGPILLKKISLDDVQRGFENFHDDMAGEYRQQITGMITELPVLERNECERLAVMLFYVVNGYACEVKDIRVLKNENEWDKGRDAGRTQSAIFNVIKLRQAVECGNFEFIRELDMTAVLKCLLTDMRLSEKSAFAAACSILTVCTQAAVEGGLSISTAEYMTASCVSSLNECRSEGEIVRTLCSAIEELCRSTARKYEDTGLSREIRFCCDYISLHPDTELDIEHLARRCGYAKYYLTQKFKKETGVNMSNYIRDAKIQRACFYLRNTDMTVKEIGEVLKFSSVNYFSQVFHKAMGISAQEYMRRNRIEI